MVESSSKVGALERLRLGLEPSEQLVELIRNFYRPESRRKAGRVMLKSMGYVDVQTSRGTHRSADQLDSLLPRRIQRFENDIAPYRSHRLPLMPYVQLRTNPRGMIRLQMGAVPLVGQKKAIETVHASLASSPPGMHKINGIGLYADIFPLERADDQDVRSAADALRDRLVATSGPGYVDDSFLYVRHPQLLISSEPYIVSSSSATPGFVPPPDAA